MISPSESLKGKAALVTGATRGLGRALALEYGRQGCDLHLVARNPMELAPVIEEIVQECPDIYVHAWECDLSSKEEINSLIDALLPTAIDILVNCAGVFPVNTLWDTTIEEYERCMSVNVTAPFLLMKEISPGMVSRGWGRIINVASSSAYAGGPRTSVYAASKHALLGLSRALYKELKDRNVRVQCASPGSIQTEMGRDVEKMGQDFDTFMTPEEVAEYIVYNSSLNGNLIVEELRLNRVFIQ